MNMESVDRYQFGADEEDMQSGVCIVKATEVPQDLPEGIRVQVFEQIAVVYPADPGEN